MPEGFNERHPDLNPSPYCGEVKSYMSEKLIDGKSVVVEWYERDPVTGEMTDVLERKKLEQEIAKMKKELQKYENA